MNDINEFLAVDVMGWELANYQTMVCDPIPYYFQKEKPSYPYMRASDWNPCENIEQAMMCAEKMDRVDWRYLNAAHHIHTAWARKELLDLFTSHASGKSAAEAISIAIAKAAGWER